MDKITRSTAGEQAETDPVCKMTVKPETAAASFDYLCKTYYFCNVNCKAKFAADPEKYLSTADAQRLGDTKAETRAVASVPGSDETAAIEYTCPMHPEIVQIGPGSCPICGMALEPKVATLDDAPDPEYVDMKRRFWVCAMLTIPVFLLAMSEMFVDFNTLFPALPHGQASAASMWIQFILATPVVLWGGWPFFMRAWASIKNSVRTCSR
jgi:Cu+-exporting ATPase